MSSIGEPRALAGESDGARTAVMSGPPLGRDTTVQHVRPAPLMLEVQPSIDVGRRQARYVTSVVNIGARQAEVRLSVISPAGLRAKIFAPASRLGSGERSAAEIVLRARRRRIFGRELQHRATVQARCEDGGAVATREIVFVQERSRAWMPAVLLLVLAGGAIAALTQWPQRVAVPKVEGATDSQAAGRALRDAGLELDPRIRSRSEGGVAPGTVLDQIPEPGTKLDRGDRVMVLVAVSAKRSVTPVLTGLTPDRAAATLRAAGLTPGPVLPESPPAGAVVATQLPAAGQRVPAGSAVTVVLRAGSSKTQPAPAGGALTVPEIDGRSPSEYARAVAAAGLVPKVIRAIDPAPLGTLVGVRPQAGVPLNEGDVVRLRVAAGQPRLAFDTGDVVRVFDPRSGRTVREASPPQGKAVEPSWSVTGRQVVYRVGRRLLLVSAAAGERGRVVYDGKDKFVAPTFAPAPGDGVLALVRRTGGDGDLCFARAGDGRLRPRCAADKRWDLGRQISWHPDGRELLVFGVRRGKPETFGMLRYRSERPFSTNPKDWRGAPATDMSVPGRGVIAAAYAPSGKRVGLVTNVGLPRFQLLVAELGEIRAPGTAALPVRACEIAWRPDGGELAVVQSDDACARPLGQLVRVDPDNPREPITVSSGGRHPTYQPLTYAGPKGVG